MSCCDQVHDSTELADPTMDACCARAEIERARAHDILARLQAVDPSMDRMSLAADIVGSVPQLNTGTARHSEAQEEENDSGISAHPAGCSLVLELTGMSTQNLHCCVA